MPRRARHASSTPPPEIPAELIARLRERSAEIEEAIFTRICAVAGERPEDPSYAMGLRQAVAAAMDYGLAGAEQVKARDEALPRASAAQARRAAQAGVGLDTVLRRYMAGDRRFSEFILEESEQLPAEAARQVIRTVGAQFERLIALVSAEYTSELERIRRSPQQQLADWVQEILDGEDPADGGPEYRFGAWHLGMVASGSGAQHKLQGLAARLESQLLLLPRPDGTAWVWLGRQRPIAFAELRRQVRQGANAQLSLAIGESRKGVAGWRLTHREAQAAQQVMIWKPQTLIRCGQVALLAALLQNDLLGRALVETYLQPLQGRGNADRVLRETLRTYFATSGNTAATASALEVNRHTIHRRLRRVEQRLDSLLHTCHAELDVALRLEELLDGFSPT